MAMSWGKQRAQKVGDNGDAKDAKGLGKCYIL